MSSVRPREILSVKQDHELHDEEFGFFFSWSATAPGCSSRCQSLLCFNCLHLLGSSLHVHGAPVVKLASSFCLNCISAATWPMRASVTRTYICFPSTCSKQVTATHHKPIAPMRLSAPRVIA